MTQIAVVFAVRAGWHFVVVKNPARRAVRVFENRIQSQIDGAVVFGQHVFRQVDLGDGRIVVDIFVPYGAGDRSTGARRIYLDEFWHLVGKPPVHRFAAFIQR